MMAKGGRLKRLGANIPESQHKELHAILALRGKTITQWLLDKVHEELSKKNTYEAR